MHKSFRNKRIKVNKKAVKEDYRIVEGDLIELYINDEFFTVCDYSSTVEINTLVHMPKIVFEDENLLIVDKPAGLLCHTDNTQDIALIDILIKYLVETGKYDPAAENRFSPALCNRIDRGTNGIVICAKNYSALRDMNEIIRLDLLKKQYLCVVQGVPKSNIYTAFHKRDLTSKKVSIASREKPEYKEIKTGVTVIETKQDLSLCKVDLYTGKTHQIRAHLSFLNHPLVGDRKYGNAELNSKYRQKNQLLSSYRIIFSAIPPENTLKYLSGKKISLENCQTKSFFKHLKQ